MSDQRDYDTPKALIQNMDYDSPRTTSRASSYNCQLEESYDVPRPILQKMPSQNIAKTNTEPFPNENSKAISMRYVSSNSMSHYDVPKKLLTFPRVLDSTIESFVYDIPSAVSTNRGFQLQMSPALGILTGLEVEITSAASRLIGFISADWRSESKMKLTIMDIKTAVNHLILNLDNLVEFCNYILGNLSKADDKRLSSIMSPLVNIILNATKFIHALANDIDWTVESLTLRDDNTYNLNDNLNQLISCVRSLIEDSRVTKITSFIQGNATLLFDSIPRHIEDGVNAKKIEAHNDQIAYCMLPQSVDTTCVPNDPSDKPLLIYYGTQIVGHIRYISKAVDAFLQSVERNQPPKHFLSYGKFVILSAFNIITTGDIVHRNMTKSDLKTRVFENTNSLSDALKNFVTKTKRAAQHFPSVIAVQEMVDSVVKVSHLAYELKMVILQELNP